MPSPHVMPRRGLPQGSSNKMERVTISSAAELKCATKLSGRERLFVQPLGGDLYFGVDSDITTGDKSGLIPQNTFFEFDGRGTWYGVAASAIAVTIYEVVD